MVSTSFWPKGMAQYTEESAVSYTHLDVYKRQAPASPQRQWVDAVTKGTPVTVGIDEAVALTVVMEGAYRAYQTEQRYSF